MNSRLPAVTISVLSVFFLVSMPAASALAQGRPADPHVLTNPKITLPVQFGISPPLAQLTRQLSSQQGSQVVLPVLHPKGQLQLEAAQQAQVPLADGALQTSPGALVSASIGLNLLGIGVGFPTYTVPDAPTDTNLAVGDTQVVQWVNVSYAVFDKATGAVIAGPILGNALWATLGGACATHNDGDPIVQWDKLAHVWVLTQNVFSPPYMTCVAVSQTSDATGSYYLYAFPQAAGFPDYPKWGLMPDAYYQSQNVFNSNPDYIGVRVCAYERAKLLVGDPTAQQICFLDNSGGTLFDDSLLPADLDSAATPPPIGQDEVFLGSIDNVLSGTHVYQYLFHADFVTPANSTFTGTNGSMPITVQSFTLPCSGGGVCVPQPGTADELDSLGDRLMYRLAYRNFSGDHQTWLVSHSVVAGTSVGERWYEFHAPENSTALSVYQQGTFAPDTNYRWMGSIAMDAAQDMLLGYSLSSSTVYPSIYYTGRTPQDALGTMESEASIIDGTGSQTDTANRWGDYTSMALDAADDCTFWYTNQYYTTTKHFGWSTRLASLKFPGCIARTITFVPDSERVQIARSTTPNSDRVNMALTFIENGAPTCDEDEDALNSGIGVDLFEGTCASMPNDGLTLKLAPFVVHTINHQSYGALLQTFGMETVSARMAALATPMGACGEWTLNLEVSGLNTTAMGLGGGNPFGLLLSDLSGDGEGCLDITNAIVGTQVPPGRRVRRGVRR